MSIREINRILEEKPQIDVEKEVIKLESLAGQIIERSGAFKRNCYRQGNEEALQRLVLLAERVYSCVLNISWSMPCDVPEKKLLNDENARQGSMYDITGTKEEGFLIKVPFLPKRYEQKRMKQSRMIEEVTRQMIINHLKTSGETMPVYERTEVIFTAYLGEDIPFAQMPDADNLEIKYVLDAIGGTLLQNDSLLGTTIRIKGKKAEGRSYTSIFVSADDGYCEDWTM